MMTREVLGSILDGVQGAKRIKDEFAVPADLDLTLYVASNGEGLSFGRVTRVELKAGYLSLETAKGEHLCVAFEGVFALRWQEGGAERRAAGIR